MKFLFSLTLALCCAAPAVLPGADRPLRYEAAGARLNPATVENAGKTGVVLKPGVEPRVQGKSPTDDVVFSIRAPEPGVFFLRLGSSTDETGTKLMRAGTRKEDSLFVKLQLDDGLPTRRVAFVPWNHAPSYESNLGKFELTGKPQQLALNLPRGLVVNSLELVPYTPPEVPEAAQKYQPRIVPPKDRPRLFMTSETLPQIRANLEKGENRALWGRIAKLAKTPYAFSPDPAEELTSMPGLEAAIRAKAFYFQMTGDRNIGREACDLALNYLPRVEFGNVLDVTRPLGRAIYAGAVVYDYGYTLLTPEERTVLRKHLRRLADDMECGWPPFKQSVINGHGAEMQINRDLLSWGIAVYDEDPEPYRLCAYRLWEELLPMREFDYRSPRHSQGINYGYYRFLCEMHAVWLMSRLAGSEQFAPNIKEVGKYFLYMRLPDGEMLRDGDGLNTPGEYRKVPLLFMLMANYARDPVLKGEFLLRQGGMNRDIDELGLMVNDPALTAAETPAGLPLTIDFGTVKGGMIARTGWKMGKESDDAIVEVKGGGYNFANHQHSDAGSFQIYYRGLLAADLGIYKFYGTPNDMVLNKRSIVHNMMRVFDPDEKPYLNFANDGGARYFQASPASQAEAQTDPRFRNGTVNYCNFGPDRQDPDYSAWSAELASAYSDKVTNYDRTFCFLNLRRPGLPGLVIIADDLTSRKPEFKKTWQVNTFNPPQVEKDAVILENRLGGRTGRAHVQMLLPAPADRTMTVLNGDDARRAGGELIPVPAGAEQLPEAHGSRIEFSPREARLRDRFLTVIQLTDDRTAPLPVKFREVNGLCQVEAGDRLVAINPAPRNKLDKWEVEVAAAPRKVLLLGLEAGNWQLTVPDGNRREVTIEAGRNTFEFEAARTGVYRMVKP